MAFDHYIENGAQRLRCGYTTGTCAALAAAGAASLLLSGEAPRALSLITPKGIPVTVEPVELFWENGAAVCGVAKDGGDDADATDGLVIRARVETIEEPEIRIDGGEGVGRVTKPGLDQPPGAAAINRVPRRMIEEQARRVCDTLGYAGGLSVCISVPGGEEAAKRTFNPMLGIEGGISILGTSGIVEPMSEKALVDTIAVELRQAAALGARDVILTPGNYGETFLRDHPQAARGVPVVKCSNFIGDALDLAGNRGFSQVLLVGHAGKLVKLAAGVMNTHSRYADGRAEVFCAHAAVCGAPPSLCRSLMQAPSADACLALLDDASLREPVIDSILTAIQHHLDRRAGGRFRTGAVLFTNTLGLLGQTTTAKEIIRSWN